MTRERIRPCDNISHASGTPCLATLTSSQSVSGRSARISFAHACSSMAVSMISWDVMWLGWVADLVQYMRIYNSPVTVPPYMPAPPPSSD